jgi:N-acetylglucosamine malate deacetylase 1
MEIVVFAAHADDEVLGMGGTIKKLSKNNNIHLCVATDSASAQYSNKKMILVRKNSCKKAAKILGISTIDFLDFPDMKLDTIEHLELNKKIEVVIKKYNPEVVFTTPDNDLNLDHKLLHESTLIVTRPQSSNVKQILCYEIPGIVKTPFFPNIYEDVSKYFDFKIRAFKKYKSEIEKFPHPRSVETLTSLAKLRGSESNLKMAEAFTLIREIIY